MNDRALARNSDPDTSHAAAASVRVSHAQVLVHSLLSRVGPCTDEELSNHAFRLGVLISPSGLRSRRNELTRLGMVRDTGERERTLSGRQSIVWEAL